MATDGGYLMALQGRGVKIATREDEDGIEDMLKARVPKPHYGVEITKLKEWAGPVPEKREWVWEGIDEEHWGSMFDLPIDRRRLACIVENLPFGMVQVWNASKVIGVKGIGIDAKGFRALLAGLKGDNEAGTPKFSFRGDSPKKGTELLDELPQE